MKLVYLLVLGGLSWSLAAETLNFDPDTNCLPTAVVTSVRETSLLALAQSLPCVSQPVLHVDDGAAPSRFMPRRLIRIEPELAYDDVATFEDAVTASGAETYLGILSAGGEVLPAMVKCRFCKTSVSVGDSIDFDRAAFTVSALFVNSISHIVAKLEDPETHLVSFKDITFAKIRVAPSPHEIPRPTVAEHVLNLNPLFNWYTERRLTIDPSTARPIFESGEGYLAPRLIFHEQPAILASALNRTILPWDHEVLEPGDRLRIANGVVRVLSLYVNGTVTAYAAKVSVENDGTTRLISLSNQESVLELGKNTEAATPGPNLVKQFNVGDRRAVIPAMPAL